MEKNKFHFLSIVNLLIAIAASIVLFLTTNHYSLEFFAAYLFFLIGGAGTYAATENGSKKSRNSFPSRLPIVVICYLYWAFTSVLAFISGISVNLSVKLFLLLELLPLTIGVLLIVLFQSISEKFAKDDEGMRVRDSEINEIRHRITVLGERALALNEKIQPAVSAKIASHHEVFKYSEIISPHYTADMIQSLYNELTTAENEMDAALDIQPDEASDLENVITHLITVIKNNDEVCKTFKRLEE